MSTYETHHLSDSRLPFIFHAISRTVDDEYICDNWHENLELLLIRGGSGAVTLNTHMHKVAAGDIVVINSNIIHTINSDTDGIDYFCLIIDRSFCRSNFVDTNELWFDEVIHDGQIEKFMQELAQRFEVEEKQSADILAIRGEVLRIVSRLCELYCQAKGEQHGETRLLSCLKQAIGFIRSEYTRDISLDEVSEFVGLSKYYFAREFRRITGYSFVEYINILRCDRAQQLLLNSKMTVWEVGLSCGFQNRAYFTRTFARYVGSTPNEFRKEKSRA